MAPAMLRAETYLEQPLSMVWIVTGTSRAATSKYTPNLQHSHRHSKGTPQSENHVSAQDAFLNPLASGPALGGIMTAT